MLDKSKLDSIKTWASQALIDMEISHEEFNAIIRERKKKSEDERECKECQWKTREYEIKCEFKKITSLWMIY